MRVATTTQTTVCIALTVGVGIVGVSRLDQPTPSFDVSSLTLEYADPTSTLDLLCGAQPATFGTLLDGIELGRVVDKLPEVTPPSDVKIALLTTGRRVDGVDITIPADPGWASCYQFTKQLHKQWGDPSESSGGSEIWRDAAHHRVATFTDNVGDCSLRFSREVPAEQWLNKTKSSLVPIWAIGRKVTELEKALGLPPGDDPDELTWRDESLGDPFSDIELTAHVRRGRIIGITVAPPFESAVADILWKRLKTLYGAPDIVTGHEDAMEVRWRRAGISAGKYWGQDALVPQVVPVAGGGVKLVSPPPPTPHADDGVLVSITFGK